MIMFPTPYQMQQFNEFTDVYARGVAHGVGLVVLLWVAICITKSAFQLIEKCKGPASPPETTFPEE